MKILGYVRLSRASREESTSIARQREVIEKTCAARGFELVEIIEDVDVSATRTRLDRPGLNVMRRRVQTGEADAVLVWRLDRLVRSVVDVGILLDEGLQIISATESLDTTSPMGRAMVEILQVFAAMEAKTIGVRVSASQEHLRKVGRFPGGVVPYGYKSVPHPDGVGRALAVHPEEAAIVRRMADEVLNGASIYAVTTRLNADRIPPRRAKEWDPSSVKRILRSDAILGRVRLGGVHEKGRDGRTRTTKRADVVRDERGLPVAFWEPILTVAEVEELRRLTEWRPIPGRSEATIAGKRRPGARMLSGMLTCATCGGLMVAKSRHTTERPVYTCNARARGRVCSRAITVEANRIEDEVARQFLASAGHLKIVEARQTRRDVAGMAGVEEAIRDTTVALQAPDADLGALVARLTALRVERERLSELPAAPVVEYVRTGETFGERWASANAVTRRELLMNAGATIGLAPAARRGHWDSARVTVDLPLDRAEDFDAV